MQFSFFFFWRKNVFSLFSSSSTKPIYPTVCANNSDVAHLCTGAFEQCSIEEDDILNGCALHLPRGICFATSLSIVLSLQNKQGSVYGQAKVGWG